MIDQKREKYLLVILISSTFSLKDYKSLDGEVTFIELRDRVFKYINTEKYKILFQNRLKELKEIYPPDIYPEKWI